MKNRYSLKITHGHGPGQRDRLAKLEGAGVQPPGGNIELVNQAKYSAVLKEKETDPDICPAKRKVLGGCYGVY